MYICTSCACRIKDVDFYHDLVVRELYDLPATISALVVPLFLDGSKAYLIYLRNQFLRRVDLSVLIRYLLYSLLFHVDYDYGDEWLR